MGPGCISVRVWDGRDLGDDGEGGEDVFAQSVSGYLDGASAQLTGRKKFEVEKLSTEDVEMEDLNFYYADYSR